MSRTTYSEFQYIKAAKDFLNEYTDYQFAWNWEKTGKECGYDAAPTYEELMIDLLSRQPLWSDYKENSGNTQRMKDLFVESDLPYGPITSNLIHNGISIDNKLDLQLWRSDYE
jgi:hypothetical protein